MDPASLGVSEPACRLEPSGTQVSAALARALTDKANAAAIGGRRFEVVGKLPAAVAEPTTTTNDDKPTTAGSEPAAETTTDDQPAPKRRKRSRAVRTSQE